MCGSGTGSSGGGGGISMTSANGKTTASISSGSMKEAGQRDRINKKNKMDADDRYDNLYSHFSHTYTNKGRPDPKVNGKLKETAIKKTMGKDYKKVDSDTKAEFLL